MLCIALSTLEETGLKMKKFKQIILALFLLLSSCWGEQKLVFGVNPYQDPASLKEIFKEFLDYLEKELDCEIVFLVSNDYLHLATLIESQKVDFASISPKLLSTVRQHIKETNYLATIKIKDEKNTSKSTYRGLIVGQNNGVINHLSDLKGKKFGFTDKESTSGYFYPQMLLKEAGIDCEKDFSQVFMLKKHPKIIGALLENSIDAGAVYEGTYKEMKNEIGNKLKIIATTEEIPYDAIVASPHLSSKIVDKIKKALLKFESNTSLESGIVGFEEKPVWMYDRFSTLP